MTASNAISAFDVLRSNNLTSSVKTAWVTELDKKAFAELLKFYAPEDKKTYTAMKGSSDELLLPDEFGEIYVLYLVMKFDQMNGETVRFNNSVSQFNKMWYDITNYVSRSELANNAAKIRAGELYV